MPRAHIFRTDTPEREQIDRIYTLMSQARGPMRLVNDEGVSEEVPDRLRSDLVRLLITALDHNVVLAQIIPDQVSLDEAAVAANLDREHLDELLAQCPLDLSEAQSLGYLTRNQLVGFAEWERRMRAEAFDAYWAATEDFRGDGSFAEEF